MVKKFLIIILFVFSAQLFGYPDTLSIRPLSQHQRSDQLIYTLLNRFHYKKFNLNDSLSSKILDRYINNLDYYKLYFTQEDINSFEKYRDELDDDIKVGRLKPAYDIFNLLIDKMRQRDESILKLLDKEPDFTIDESYEADRKNAKWAKNQAELDEIWRKRIKNEALNEKLKGKEWKDIADILSKRYKTSMDRMFKYNSEDIFSTFINSFTENIDPHTNYLSPNASENFQIAMKLSLDGIGAQLGMEDEYTKVVAVVAGGPAFKSDLIHENDKIIAVAQGDTGHMVDVIGWRLDDVVKLIRGPKGTTVRLQILEAEEGLNSTPKEIRLVRDKIKLEESAAQKNIIELMDNGTPFKLGVITLPAFYFDYEAQQRGEKDYRSTTRDVKRILQEFKDQRVDGVIMDLRNNGGGSLQEAIDLTGLFIKDGPVVQVKGSDGSVEQGRDPDPGIFYDGPFAVLVNRASASASEIFAGAIQDYKRGLIIGDRTYGKGTVQTLRDLNQFGRDSSRLGQLKITIAKFYRVSGGSTQHLGVIPDIQLPSIIDSSDYGESSEPSALPWDQIQSSNFDVFRDFKAFIPKLLQQHNERVKSNIPYQNLLEEINEYKSERDDQLVSLNEEKRKRERDEAENKKFERENENRQASGLKLLEKGEVAPKADKIDDPLLKETANILSDLILLTSKNQ